MEKSLILKTKHQTMKSTSRIRLPENLIQRKLQKIQQESELEVNVFGVR
jgi:hypothetical protein